MQKLERAQNKALRMVTWRYNSTSAEALLMSITAEEADILPRSSQNVLRSNSISSWGQKSGELRRSLTVQQVVVILHARKYKTIVSNFMISRLFNAGLQALELHPKMLLI